MTRSVRSTARRVLYCARGDPQPAQAVCGECHVQRESLSFAVNISLRHGVWGGTTETNAGVYGEVRGPPVRLGEAADDTFAVVDGTIRPAGRKDALEGQVR